MVLFRWRVPLHDPACLSEHQNRVSVPHTAAATSRRSLRTLFLHPDSWYRVHDMHTATQKTLLLFVCTVTLRLYMLCSYFGHFACKISWRLSDKNRKLDVLSDAPDTTLVNGGEFSMKDSRFMKLLRKLSCSYFVSIFFTANFDSI